MARYKIKVQFEKTASITQETDDFAQAERILKREINKAERPSNQIVSIFLNNTMKWRRR